MWEICRPQSSAFWKAGSPTIPSGRFMALALPQRMRTKVMMIFNIEDDYSDDKKNSDEPR